MVFYCHAITTNTTLLPHLLSFYYHKHHIYYHVTTKSNKKKHVFTPFSDRFMMQLISSNRRSDDCFQPSGKAISTIEQVHPRLCPTLPGALGTFNRDCRLKAPTFPGMVAHVPGHKYSCSWVQSGKNVVSFLQLIYSTHSNQFSGVTMAFSFTSYAVRKVFGN